MTASVDRNIRRSITAARKRDLSGRRTKRILHLDTKQVELVRVLFSIDMTAFVSVGTFVIIRHLVGLYE
jgi:hypothetical protein